MSLDRQLVAFLNQTLAQPWLDALMVAVSISAIPLLIMAPLLLVLFGRRREAFALVLTLTVATLLTLGVQHIVMRPRPMDIRLVLPAPSFPSFPSGHAAAAFGCATLVSLIWRRTMPLAVASAILVSASRVYLGHHYASDVLGGAMMGTVVAGVVYDRCYQRPIAARPIWAWLLWVQVGAVLLVSLAAYTGLLRIDLLAVPGIDKVLHLILAGGLAFLALAWWAEQPAGPVLAILALLAAGEEALQGLSPNRSFDLLDLAAAVVGIALFGLMGVILRTRWAPAEKL